jgi:alpha-tubulin suppressor-like RCC1 family protein
MLVRGLGLGVVVVVMVVFGLSVSAAGAAAPAGGVLAFGSNGAGQLGSITNNGTNNPNPTPTVVGLPGEIGPVTQVAAGGGHGLVVTAGGQLYAFGSNEYGQLGSATNSGTNNPNPTPTVVGLPGEIGPVTQVAAGSDHSLAVTASGQLYAFGFNYYGQLGRSANTSSGDPNPTPTVVTLPGEIGPVTQVAAGANHSLAVTASGQLYAFGYNGYGGLGSATNSGTGNPSPTPTPVSLPGEIGPVTRVAAGGAHSLAVTASGQLYAFGLNGEGELGSATNTGTNNPNPTPALVRLPGEIGPVTQVAAGSNHSLAVTASGQLYAFGYNEYGQLGTATNSGTNNPNPTPALVTLPGEIGPVTQVAAGIDHSLAVTASGQLYAFGLNESGQLGSATNSGTVSPNPTPTLVKLASGTTIDTVAKGEGADHTLVIVSDLAITTSALPVAQAGSSYQAALTATGGTTPLAWSQTGLPSGLSIDPQTGVLAGTPPSAGSSEVTTTATDSYGNQTSHTYTLTINAAPPPIKAPPPPRCGAGQTATPPGCHTPPLLTHVHQSHRDWRERSSRPSKRDKPTGTTFSYTLNEPATVTLAFTQRHPGRRILAHRCQTPTKTNHNKPRCTRTQTIATLTATGHVGPNHLSFKGRISRSKKLWPGTYTLVITAHAFGSTSRPRTLTFTILAG